MGFHHIWPIFILAMAISIDGFAVGVTYGIRKIKIGFLPLLLVGSISAMSIYLTNILGSTLADKIGLDLAKKLGSLILVGIGIWVVYSAYINCNSSKEDYNNDREKESHRHEDILAGKKLLLSFKIKSMGLIINILKEPVTADFDKSGTINYAEAFFLGFALALDALGAGLGAGLTGYTGLWIPIIIGTITVLFVGGGVLLGHKVGNFLPEHFEVIPGFIIICLGILNFF